MESHSITVFIIKLQKKFKLNSTLILNVLYQKKTVQNSAKKNI